MESLLDVSDTVLCVVDVQPGFLGKLKPKTADEVVARIRWLTRVSVALGVPVVVTEEDSPYNGATVEPVLSALPPGTAIHDKTYFGLADQPDILGAVERTRRRTAVLCGLETDVCVAHSALGLLDREFRVAVVADAVASPGMAHQFGIDRLRETGVTLLSAKGVAFEWLRTVGRSEELDEVLSSEVPPGVIL